MAEKLVVPEKLKDTHIQAKDILGRWYLIPLALIKDSREIKYECWLYNASGKIDKGKPYHLTKKMFGF